MIIIAYYSALDGGTDILKALREANEVLFGNEFPFSQIGRQKILFIITDGLQTQWHTAKLQADLKEEVR